MSIANAVLRLALFLLPSVGGIVAQTPSEEAISRADSNTRRFALAVSGGISKGSYQAGVTLGLLRAARLYQGSDTTNLLVAATGASAGNINVLLAAVEYCRAKPVPAEQTVLWDAWTRVGVNELLIPRTLSQPQRRKANLLRALLRQDFLRDSVGARVLQLMDSAYFRPHCMVPLGVTLTRQEPDTVQLTDGFPVPVTRMATVARAVTAPQGHLELKHHDLSDSSRARALGVLISLEQDCAEVIRKQRFLDASIASAAFPLAFPPVTLTYGYRRGNDPGAGCKESPRLRGRYLDGGVFDNNPVDLLGGLVEDAIRTSSASADTARMRELGRMDAELVDAKARSQEHSRQLAELTSKIRDQTQTQRSVQASVKLCSQVDTASATGSVAAADSAKRGCESLRLRADTLARSLTALNQLADLASSMVSLADNDRGRLEQAIASIHQHFDSVANAKVNADSARSRFTTFFVDPDNSRSPERDELVDSHQRSDTEGGIADLLTLVRSFLPSARSYELQVATRVREAWFTKSINQTRRSERIAGSALGAFGAFLAQELREHDFAVGLFDGLRAGHSRLMCGDNRGRECQDTLIARAILDTGFAGPRVRSLMAMMYVGEGNRFTPVTITKLASERTVLTALLAAGRASPSGSLDRSICANRDAIEMALCASTLGGMLDTLRVVCADEKMQCRQDTKALVESPRRSIYRVLDAVVTQLRFLEESPGHGDKVGRWQKALGLTAERMLHSLSSYYDDDPRKGVLTIGSTPCRTPWCEWWALVPGTVLFRGSAVSDITSTLRLTTGRWQPLVPLGVQSATSEGVGRHWRFVSGVGVRRYSTNFGLFNDIDLSYLGTWGEGWACGRYSASVAMGATHLAGLFRTEIRWSPDRGGESKGCRSASGLLGSSLWGSSTNANGDAGLKFRSGVTNVASLIHMLVKVL